jgi:hypothetical protein
MGGMATTRVWDDDIAVEDEWKKIHTLEKTNRKR